LETDESDWSIAKIYFFAAQILEIGEETLVDQFSGTINTFFRMADWLQRTRLWWAMKDWND
jgi:hypothetical protein